jgi:small-conductance mechanosensitive channel
MRAGADSMIARVLPAPAAVFGLPEWAGRLVLAGLVVAGALVLLSVVGWLVPRLVRRAVPPGEAPRSRQRQTAVNALESALRYLILIAAVVALTFALAGGGSVAAVSGGALVVIIVGFAFQRLLVDAIAGFFILFEDEYGVGDVVRLEPSGYTGEVESIGLRATVLRGPGSERIIVPNGQVIGVRVIPDGRRRVRLELLSREPEAVRAVIHEVAGALAGAGGPWDGPPRVVLRPTAGELTRVIAIVEVDPEREDAAASWLADAVAARAGDLLVGPPLATGDRGR